MREGTFAARKATPSNSAHPSLVSPNSPTLANPVRGFGLPTNNVIQTATDVSTELQEIQSNDEQSSEQQAFKEKPISHDISRIPVRHPQAKLTVGEVGDKYEQEADMMAHQVMSMSAPTVQQQMSPVEVPTTSLLAQREAILEEEEEIQAKPLNTSIHREILQRASNSNLEVGDSIESQLNSSKGGGSPLSSEVQSFMEPRFGFDFSQVRVHTNREAVQMNRDLNAQAFTHGSDVYFGEGKAPGNNDLTAHELTHVVQQTGNNQIQRRCGFDESCPEETMDTHVTEHPVTEGDLNTAPTGIEGSSVEPIFQDFINAVRSDVNDWRSYRNTFEAPIPGANAYEAVVTLEQRLQNYNFRSQQEWLEGMGDYIPFDRYDDRVHGYLSRELGSEELFLLREMLSFGLTPTGSPAIGSVAVAEFFNLQTIPLNHRYTCEVTYSTGVKGGAFLMGGVTYREIIIHYQNDLGMRYSKHLDLTSGLFGGGAGYGINRQGGRNERGVSDGSPALGISGNASGPADPQPVVFWQPEDFEGGFSAAQAGGGVRGSVGPLGLPGGECKLFEALTFYEMDRGIDITFRMSDLGSCGMSGAEVSPSGQGVGGSMGGSIDVETGNAEGGTLEVTAPDIPPPERRESGEWRVLFETQIFFDTGDDALGSEANDTIHHLLERVDGFQQLYPDYGLRFEITGHASPRWRSARGEIPYDLNVALSERRANQVLEQLRNGVRVSGDADCDFTVESCGGQQQTLDDPTEEAITTPLGSLEALSELRDPDDNWWYDRRVDVVVYRNEFGFATDEAPGIPHP